VKAVFFDAGGTLVHIDYARVAAVVRAELGREIPAEAWIAGDYAGRDAIEAAMASGESGSDSSRWLIHFRAMMEAVGLSRREFERIGPRMKAAHTMRHLWSAVQDGTREGLASLHRAGYFVACISNADGTVERLLESVGLLHHLAFVVDSGKVGIEKPDPRIFELALRQAGMRPDESLYVGDLYPVDVVGARAAGLTPVLLDPLGRYGERDCRTAPNVAALCRELVSAREAA
jgi:putative hydrolase of the HAD superfamily